VSTEINNESGVPVDEAALVRLSRFVLDALQINPLAELSVVLVDADAMTALHQQWMDLPGPTDVLAFPMDGLDGPPAVNPQRHDPSAPPPTDEAGGALLGDVVLCPTVAGEQARTAGHSLDAELALLCTHGVLHLLGYDHAEPDQEQQMFELQGRLLAEWTAATNGEPIRVPVPGTAGERRDTAGGRRA
jgi:probable rRNA maturation factor